jgi:hypothetical protein
LLGIGWIRSPDCLEGIELEFDIRGSGEPIVLIHPGRFADWFMPLGTVYWPG